MPVVGLVALLMAMAAAVAASSLTVVLRDIKNAIPFLVQLWMYASPVLYPVDWIPAPLRPYAGFNPIAGLLAAFRACLFGMTPDWGLIARSGVSVLVLIGVSVAIFHRLEADLAERA